MDVIKTTDTNNIGIILDPNSFQNISDVVLKAESYNFHSAWVTELYRSSFEQLVHISSITNKIKIGSAVTLGFVRSPFSTMISAMDIDEISKGRLIFGLGSGAINTNRKWHGIENFDRPSERISSLLKSLKIIEKSLNNSKDILYNDEFINIDIKAFRRPFKPFREEIPIFIAGIGPKMTNIALNQSDGYIGHVVCSKDYINNNIIPLKKKKFSTLSSIVLCAINKNKLQAIEDCKGTIAFYSTVKAYSEPFRQLGFEENIISIRKHFFEGNIDGMISNVSNEMVEKFALVGNRDEVKEGMLEFKNFIDLPILTAPHYYLNHEKLEIYQNEILETFKF